MKRNWFWGVFFVLAAGILITSQLGVLTVHIGFWTLLLAMFLVAALVESLMHISVGGIVFSLAFLAILFAKPLGIAQLAPWTILGAAVLLTIGLSMIFRPRWCWQGRFSDHHGENWHGGRHGWGRSVDTITDVNDSETVVDVNMSSSIRYLQSDNLKSVRINSSMGNAKVYFDDVVLSPEGAVAWVDNSFGGVELYVPKEWQVRIDLSTDFGTFGERGENAGSADQKLVVKGRTSFGSVVVFYI